MSAVFKLDQSDLRAITDLLDRLEVRLGDMRPAWDELRVRWQERAREQFTSARWKPLSRRYAQAIGRTRATLDTSVGRAPKGLRHPPGSLRRAVTAPDTFEPTKDSLVMGVRWGVGRSPAFYMQFHQQGRGVPRRPVWTRLSAGERRDWNDVVIDHVLEAIHR